MTLGCQVCYSQRMGPPPFEAVSPFIRPPLVAAGVAVLRRVWDQTNLPSPYLMIRRFDSEHWLTIRSSTKIKRVKLTLIVLTLVLSTCVSTLTVTSSLAPISPTRPHAKLKFEVIDAVAGLPVTANYGGPFRQDTKV